MAELKHGWTGKILRVDLSAGEVTDGDTSRYVPQFIGGRAMGAKIYWEEVAPEISAYDPENRLIFTTGPAVGTLAPSANRVFVTAKSPVPYPVECYFYSSMGGHWGPELKFAGYDGLIIRGKASRPVYLWINDGKAEIRDATHLWGMISRNAQMELKKMHGDATRSVVIGPAGENRCREAIISCDTAFATGQGGFGAVMGSKNIKAIAVRGTGGVKIARPTDLIRLYSHFAHLATCKPGEGRQNPVRYMSYYTPSVKNAMPDRREHEVDHSAIGEEVAKGLVKKRVGGCFACPLSCLIGWQFKDNSIPGGAGSCNENKFCVNVENSYYGGKAIGRALIESARLHDDLGLSETQTGFKYPYEWFWILVKAGILTKENTGLPIDKIGSSEFWKRCLHQIAFREGFGALLAEGEERFFVNLMERIPEGLREKAKAIGDHWLFKSGCGYYGHWSGGGLTNALSIIQHAGEVRTNLQSQNSFFNPNQKACFLSPEELEKTVRAGALKYFGTEKVLDQHSFEDKIPAAIYLQDISFVSDSVPYCRWVFPKAYSEYTSNHLGDITLGSKIISAVTGMDMTEKEMLNVVGERGWNLERVIMVREGRRRRNDWYNETVFERNKQWLSKETLKRAMDDYYTARGWDIETGIPKREKLEELGLNDIAEELEEEYGIRVPR
jgi:aldehyde:ferredoxin oxidoreductase